MALGRMVLRSPSERVTLEQGNIRADKDSHRDLQEDCSR